MKVLVSNNALQAFSNAAFVKDETKSNYWHSVRKAHVQVQCGTGHMASIVYYSNVPVCSQANGKGSSNALDIVFCIPHGHCICGRDSINLTLHEYKIGIAGCRPQQGT